MSFGAKRGVYRCLDEKTPLAVMTTGATAMLKIKLQRVIFAWKGWDIYLQVIVWIVKLITE